MLDAQQARTLWLSSFVSVKQKYAQTNIFRQEQILQFQYFYDSTDY